MSTQTATVNKTEKRVNVRYLTVTAMLSAVAYILMFLDFSVPFMECHILRILRRIQPFQSVINRIAAIFPIMRMQRLPAMPQKVPTIYFHIKGSYME